MENAAGTRTLAPNTTTIVFSVAIVSGDVIAGTQSAFGVVDSNRTRQLRSNFDYRKVIATIVTGRYRHSPVITSLRIDHGHT